MKISWNSHETRKICKVKNGLNTVNYVSPIDLIILIELQKVTI